MKRTGKIVSIIGLLVFSGSFVFAENVTVGTGSNINPNSQQNLKITSVMNSYFSKIDSIYGNINLGAKNTVFNNVIKKIDLQLSKLSKELEYSISSKKIAKQSALNQLRSVLSNKIDENFDELMKKATLEQKIGQMILIGFYGTGMGTTGVNEFRIQENIENGSIGGVIFYGRNIVNPTQLKDFIKSLSTIRTAFPAFFAIDQEGGKVQRLKEANGFESNPSQKLVASGYNLSGAYDVYKSIGIMLLKYGFNLNFAPVVDVDVNPQSPAIGAKERSFSANPQTVTAYANQALKAYSDLKIISTLKHFPGHGSATYDTHLGFTDVTNTWSYKELLPYYELIKTGNVKMIMTAHVFNANVDSGNTATLSDKFINGILRGKFGYTGVVITDDLDMGAIANMYKQSDAIVKAINAGNDILIFSNYFEPNNNTPQVVKKVILDAIKDGKITEERINQSFERIMKLKKNLY